MMWLARNAVRRPVQWLLGGALVTLCLAAGIPRLELKTSGAALHPEENAVIALSESDRDRFEEPRQIVLLVSCDAPGCLATPEGFRHLRRVQNELESLSVVRGDGVRSIASLLRVERQGAQLSLARHLDHVPDDPTAVRDLHAALREHPLADGLLLSEDARLASFFVPLAEHRPVAELVAELRSWSDGLAVNGYAVRLTGPEFAEATLGEMVLDDLTILVPAMLVVIALLLYLTFGTLAGVMIPLIEAGVVLLWTLGAMGWLGVPVTLVTTILPVVLMAMAITDEIHLLERFAAQDPSLPPGEAVLEALRQVGSPIVITSVTTALAFLSFLSASIQPIREFGAFAAFGILSAMFLTFCWIPSLIVLLPQGGARRGDSQWSLPGLGFEALARLCIRRPGQALVTGVALILIALPGVLALDVQDSWIDNFDPDSAIARADRDFNAKFWGTYRFDVVFEADPGYFYSPAGARMVEAFTEIASDLPHVGGVVSYLVPLSTVTTAIGAEPPLSQLSQVAISDLATLIEMSAARTTLRQLLSERGDAARVRLYVNDPDYVESVALRAALNERLSRFPLPDFVRVHSSGDLPVAIEVVREIVANQIRSIAWAFASVALVLGLFFGARLEGLIAIVPVVAATAFVLGAMGYLGVSLGIATSMFASLTIGVGVDFGVHFLHGYRAERTAGADDRQALSETVSKTGAALRWNALVLALGFAVLSISSLKPNHSLGLLLAAAVLACYVATLIFLPRLSRLATLCVAAIGLLGVSPYSASANAADCSAGPDAAARAIMAAIERDMRDGTHVIHMQIQPQSLEPTSAANDSIDRGVAKTLWTVVHGDAHETRSLHVFSGPGRLAGTSLLIRDRIGTLDGDAMWLYLRSFENFSNIESTARRRTVVPGTSLTYEDAKGFIATDKYRFSFAEPPTTDTAEIIACPLTRQLAEDLGYGALRVTVGRAEQLVVAIDYQDLGGRPSKRYRVEERQRVGQRWFPKSVRLDHLANASRTKIEYEYWLPETDPPPGLFTPALNEESFRARVLRYLDSLGLAATIRAELLEADASVRRWEEKWRDSYPNPR